MKLLFVNLSNGLQSDSAISVVSGQEVEAGELLVDLTTSMSTPIWMALSS